VKKVVRFKQIESVLVIIVSVALTGCLDNITIESSTIKTDTGTPVSQHIISIACWNLQIFGPSKASNETLLEYYKEKLSTYDIFIIQEIRDSTGDAITNFAEKFPDHTYCISKRAGQSISKEQYAIFYNNSIELISTIDYTDTYQDVMQRPPFEAQFLVNNWSFTLYTLHTQPDNVYNELYHLQTIIGNRSDDTLIFGDLNADGSYFDEDDIHLFTTWNWIVTNDMDTTVASSDNTYDRILINDAAKNNFQSVGIMDDVTLDESDHYLAYATFDCTTP
jgi:deoxyribonuclease-1-like protein